MSLSKTVTVCPARFNCCAAAKPAGPEPITATVFPVLTSGGCGFIHPSAKPLSIIFFSIFSIATGSLIIPNTHDFSHGAGHKRPVNSGKLLVDCNIFNALSHSS